MKKALTSLFVLSLGAAMAFGADVKAGQAAYDKSCKSCHGAAGAPNQGVAKMMKVDMKDLGSSEIQSQTDAELKKVITEGKGKMKPIKSLSGAQVDDVVAYIRTFKK